MVLIGLLALQCILAARILPHLSSCLGAKFMAVHGAIYQGLHTSQPPTMILLAIFYHAEHQPAFILP